jgi:hypothetical protein
LRASHLRPNYACGGSVLRVRGHIPVALSNSEGAGSVRVLARLPGAHLYLQVLGNARPHGRYGPRRFRLSFLLCWGGSLAFNATVAGNEAPAGCLPVAENVVQRARSPETFAVLQCHMRRRSCSVRNLSCRAGLRPGAQPCGTRCSAWSWPVATGPSSRNLRCGACAAGKDEAPSRPSRGKSRSCSPLLTPTGAACTVRRGHVGIATVTPAASAHRMCAGAEEGKNARRGRLAIPVFKTCVGVLNPPRCRYLNGDARTTGMGLSPLRPPVSVVHRVRRAQWPKRLR